MDRVVICGGTVVDGTGTPGMAADVAVEGDRIAEIGHNLKGDRRIDAGGCVVAPGFVDVHTHYDAQVFWDPGLTPSCFHGVTTVVAGNCGFSLAPVKAEDRDFLARTMEKVEDMDPDCLASGVEWTAFESFPDYLEAVRGHGVGLNYSAYIGHTPLRLYVMGREAAERPATPEELRRMELLVEEAMAAGAAGFATSMGINHLGADGRPIPSRVATKEEIVALAAVVARSGRGVVGVNGGEGLTFRECYELQPRMGAPLTFTAVLTTPSGAHLKAAEIHREAWARGVQVHPQVSCRPLTFSINLLEPFNLNSNPVFADLMSESVEARRAAYGDPAWRRRARDAWAANRRTQPRWDTLEIMESDAHPELVGRRLTDIADERNGADPLDVLLDLSSDERDLQSLRVKTIVANDDPEGIVMLLNEPGCILGLSDAGAHIGQLCDAPLPTDLLGNWVRGREALGLEAAVHKLTQEPAELFGFAGRGVLRPGAFADIAVFDPETVAPGPLRRVRDFPASTERLTADSPTGMRHVLVNGVAVRTDEQQVEPAGRPGRVLSPAAGA